MVEALDQLPPEAWPIIETLLNITMVTVAIWIGVTIFVWLRRSMSNLTPVNAASKNDRAQPDFLSVDSKARAQAEARGETFDKALEKEERAAALAAARGGRTQRTMSQRLTALLSLFMSLFTLATMVFGAIWQVTRMGQMMSEYSTVERIITVVQNHPLSFSIAALVIGFHIFQFFADRQWKEG